jgi:hypothetical protein
MKKILVAATFALFASTQAFAIFGVGLHYVYNTGSLSSSTGEAGQEISIEDVMNLGRIKVNQEETSGLQGLGFKVWLDVLPFVDIEGTFNFAATRYKTFLIIPTPGSEEDKVINLSYTPDAPYSMIFGDADPLYGVVNGDLSITYPFDLPIRPYIGLGISYFASIPIVNASFADKMLKPELIGALAGENPDPDAAAAIGNALAETLKNESYTTGIGGHIIAGFRIKPPVVPVAIYANGKYYFGGNTNSQFSQGIVLEVGGGFAL